MPAFLPKSHRSSLPFKAVVSRALRRPVASALPHTMAKIMKRGLVEGTRYPLRLSGSVLEHLPFSGVGRFWHSCIF